ncbi:DUF1161 domain-containing protein [Pseudorhodoferax sp.]|uniref:DUF1161 domain-containing protein n=1 Tax=Pseudorhodoferax sp. TaxID=1993553 RepID=UPI0039E6EC77
MKPWWIPLAWLLAGSNALAQDNCEALRGDIEARIRAAGVAGFSVTVLDAAQPADGRVVGNCAMGRKKIVYARHVAPPAPAAAPMLTECRDGSTPLDGRCRP